VTKYQWVRILAMSLEKALVTMDSLLIPTAGVVGKKRAIFDMLESLNTLEIWAGITVLTGARYFVFAFIGWFTCYKLFYSNWFHRKIRQNARND
jgi:hypothetical protein